MEEGGMKKICAAACTTLLNAAFFVLGWYLLLKGYGNTFLFYVNPILTAVTFLLLGNLFRRRIGLSRVALWFSMNLLGEILGWIGLFLLSPEMLRNLAGVFFIMFFRIFMFAIVWGAVGIPWMLFRLLRNWGESRDRKIVQQSLAEAANPSPASRPARQRNLEKWKELLKTVGIGLCGLSVLLMGFSFYYFYQERPAEAYEDKGIYTFQAKNVYPTQVKNTTSRYNRRQTTRTVYIVEYRAAEHSGYRWKEEAPAQSVGKQWIREGKTTQRRVLSIKDTNQYITIDPQYTAETYVSRNKWRYAWILLASAAYLTFYSIYQVQKRERKRLEEA